MTLQIIGEFIVFIFAIFVSFFLPGLLIVSQLKIKSRLTVFLISYVLGIVMFALQGYVFGYLGIRWFVYLYITISCLICTIYRRQILVNVHRIFPSIILANKIPFLIISTGIIIQLIPVAGSGLIFSDGMRFFGNNAYDGLTHLAFIQSLIDHFPPVESGSYDLPLRNYHYFSDLVISETSRVWRIPINNLLFRFFPFLVSLLTGITAYLLVRSFGGSKKMGNWFLIVLYFGGDAAFIFMLVIQNTFGFYTPAIDNGAMQFLNMPNAMAKMIFITGLIALQYFIVSNKKMWGILSVILLSSLVGFKIYFGIFSIFGFSLFILGRFVLRIIKRGEIKFFEILKSLKKETFLFLLLLLFAGISLVIYLPVNQSSGGLSFYPLEWPKSFLGSGSIDFQAWWQRKQIYDAAKNYIGIFLLDLIAIIIALISIYGTRLLGFFPNLKLLKFLGLEKILFFIPGLFLFQFFGLYTLQVSGGFNVFNFFVVSTVILSFFSSYTLSQLSESKKIIAKALIIIFIVLTVPRVINVISNNIENYRTKEDSYLISKYELSALKYIDKYAPKDAIIQSHPNNEKDNKVGYITFLAKRLTYLSGIVFLETRNQKINDKKKALNEMFESNSIEEFIRLAKDKKIDYIYLQNTPEQRLKFSSNGLLLKEIYKNKSITIIKPI